MINLKNISGSDYDINNLVVDPQVLDPVNDGKILAGQIIDISVSLVVDMDFIKFCSLRKKTLNLQGLPQMAD